MPAAGLPRDPAQWLALALALMVLVAARPLVRPSPHPWRLVLLGALAATALSAAYVAVYLRGGPRIIDATSYYLEARVLAEGALSFPLGSPETSVLGRFLVRSQWPDGAHAAVIFPPGYPAVLALGFLAGAPLAVGPLLAGGLVVATHALATAALGPEDPGSPSVPRLAVLLSVVCAALRYQTADTMSHGLAALCFTAALALAFQALDAHQRPASPRRAHLLSAAAGLAAGWLFATRPPSGAALAVVLACAFLVPTSAGRRRPLLLLSLAAGALPGVALLVAHQHAATGAWGASSQRLYYAVSDGPPGCFRYGFGEGVGCLWEHGDFVRARLADGFGPLAAAGTTLRRLKAHLVDAANLEPLALLIPVGAWLLRASPRGRLLGLAVVAQVAVYAPFYFDGNYPGGGARLLADVLPIEHVLIAVAVAAFAARRRSPYRWAASAIALALVGFAVRAGFDHAALRDREGGLPLFRAADLAGLRRGLVFVDTDHGFNLAFDPAPAAPIQVARFHGDATDRLAWEAHGRPPAYRHHVAIPPGGGPAVVTLAPLSFASAGPGDSHDTRGIELIEGESLWPPVAQRAGWASPEFASGTCASAGRWLALHAATGDTTGDAPASVTLELPAGALDGRSVAPRVALGRGASAELTLTADGVAVRRWSLAGAHGLEAGSDAIASCRRLDPATLPIGARRVQLTLSREPGRSHEASPGGQPASAAGVVALDALELGRRDRD